MIKFDENKRRIYLELTSLCNFKCSFCPYPSLKKFRPDIDINLAKKILRDIKNIPYRIVYFHNIGEPLLYNNIGEIFSYCDRIGIKYGLTTNGFLLEKNFDIINNSGMLQLNISYQSTREELHAERKTGLSLIQYREMIISNIKKLKASGFKGEIRIKILTTGRDSFFANRKFSNIESIEELIREIDEFNYLLQGVRMGKSQKSKLLDIDINKHARIQLIPGIFVETFPFLSWGNYNQKVFSAFFGRCNAIVEQLLITSDGNVLPCCYDVKSDLIIGNARDDSLKNILHSSNACNFMADCSSIFNKHYRCQKCQGSRKLGLALSSQCASLLNIDKYYQSKLLDLWEKK